MDLGAILLTLAVTILVGLFIARPFIQHRKNPGVINANHELSALLAKREQYIEAIQELDFDHALGKIPQEDYPTTRANLIRRAALVMKELSEMQHTGKSPAELDSMLEAEISAKQSEAAQAAASSDDDIEDMLAARRATRKERSTGFCPNCGKPIFNSDKFCPSCGKPQK